MGRIRIILAVAFVALVAGVYFVRGGATPDARAAGSDHNRHGDRTGGTGTGPDARSGGPGIAVVTAAAVTKDIAETREAVGWVEPVAAVAVRARMDGLVLDQLASEGSEVKRGDVLFRLDDAAIQAAIAKDQAALLKDQASRDEANIELGRARDLLANAVDTQQQVDQQQAAVKVLDATVNMDKAQLQADQVQLGFATITAPIAGRLGVVNVTAGNLVHAADQAPLVTITEMAPLQVSFNVPERDLDRYRAALAGPRPVAVTLSTSDGGAQLAAGRLAFIDSTIDTSSGAIVMKADFSNSDGALWPGEYVHVRIGLGDDPGATVVPLVAIQQNDNGSYVFLVNPDHTVTLQPVTVATIAGEDAVVSAGLKPGDRVVVEGQLRLKDGSAIREAPPTKGSASAVNG